MILVVNGVKFYKSGREVCDLKTAAGRREYKRRILEMLYRQKGNCKICGKYLSPDEATFDHEDGRGSGGGNRNDSIWKDRKPYNSATHGRCNVEKGSKRGYDSLAQ